jgi:phenylacetate-CoA ligase
MVFSSFGLLRRFRMNQYLSPERLREYQGAMLSKLVAHAYENTVFYRKLFDGAGIEPRDIKSLDDLSKIPITRKQDIQHADAGQIVDKTAAVGECVVKHTSGSTGQPLMIYLRPAERDFQILMNLRILMENGLRLGDTTAYIINPHRFPQSKYWFQHLGILRREYLSVFDYPAAHVEALRRMRPDVIYGYPSNLTLLALHMNEEGPVGIKPRIVFSVAEALEPKARAAIDSSMGVRTCDILGTIELGDIAWQCEARTGYHLSADAVIVEFLDSDGKPVRPGEEGRIVCTSLYSYTMPFIRYAVNDICVPTDAECICGRTLPMIESIKGRANDFIVLPDGQIIASCFLVITMQEFHNVAQYRVIQKRKDSLDVQIVRGVGFESSTPSMIKREMEKAVKGSLTVAVTVVPEIPRDPSGKIRTVISEIIPGYQSTLDAGSSAV